MGLSSLTLLSGGHLVSLLGFLSLYLLYIFFPLHEFFHSLSNDNSRTPSNLPTIFDSHQTASSQALIPVGVQAMCRMSFTLYATILLEASFHRKQHLSSAVLARFATTFDVLQLNEGCADALYDLNSVEYRTVEEFLPVIPDLNFLSFMDLFLGISAHSERLQRFKC